ncbi:MAG: hypothetical protein HY902_21020 [Deltaproteobacteria bacterium]|nr:hypothetical protein [Deltaproteobacteria bacterium]
MTFGDRCTLLKLHGSVDFRDTIKEGQADSIRNLDQNVPNIGLPGPDKLEGVLYEFNQLWDLATAAMAKADQVAIVGYGLPACDEAAKAWLLDCLRDRRDELEVDLVLGPGAPVATRLSAMLGLAGVKVRRLDMWATDYLSVCGVGQGLIPADAP